MAGGGGRVNRPTLEWRYGTVAWVTNCGPNPHYHVVQATGNICLSDEGGVESLRDMLTVVGDLLCSRSWRSVPKLDTNDPVPSPGRTPLRYP